MCLSLSGFHRFATSCKENVTYHVIFSLLIKPEYLRFRQRSKQHKPVEDFTRVVYMSEHMWRCKQHTGLLKWGFRQDDHPYGGWSLEEGSRFAFSQHACLGFSGSVERYRLGLETATLIAGVTKWRGPVQGVFLPLTWWVPVWLHR